MTVAVAIGVRYSIALAPDSEARLPSGTSVANLSDHADKVVSLCKDTPIRCTTWGLAGFGLDFRKKKQPSKNIEDAIVVGLAHDCERVTPENDDDIVNWLVTHPINAIGRPPVARTQAHIVRQADIAIRRVDLNASPVSVGAGIINAERVCCSGHIAAL